MYGHLGLNLKSLGQNRKRLNELIGESPEARHDISDVAVKESVNAGPYKVITEGKKQIARSIVNNGDGSYTISLEGCTTGKTPNYTGVLTYTGQ